MSTRRGVMLALAVLGVLLMIGAIVSALQASDGEDSAASSALQLRPVVSGQTLDGETCPPPVTTADSATLCSKDGSVVVEAGPVVVDGADVTAAEASAAPGPDQGWLVLVTLNDQGTSDLSAATSAAVTSPPPANRIAVIVDDVVVTVPEVSEAITTGQLEIGGLTESEAQDLAQRLA